LKYTIETSPYLYRAPYDLVVIVSIEGQLAAEEEEHYHPNTPQVSLFAIPLHCEDLVREIDKDQVTIKYKGLAGKR
jgi:hypothetical protein